MEETIADKLFKYDKNVSNDRREFLTQLSVAHIENVQIGEYDTLIFDLVFIDDSRIRLFENSDRDSFDFEGIKQ